MSYDANQVLDLPFDVQADPGELVRRYEMTLQPPGSRDCSGPPGTGLTRRSPTPPRPGRAADRRQDSRHPHRSGGEHCTVQPLTITEPLYQSLARAV